MRSTPSGSLRFRREAQVLASLDHTNIAAIHGFEESDGVQALVLVHVEGPTLAGRIAQVRFHSTTRCRLRDRLPRRTSRA